MQTHELRDELLGQSSQRRVTLNFGRRHLFLLVVITALGAYTYSLLFGHNSLLKLLSLQEEHTVLQSHIEGLKNENADLHRLLYELRLIRGD